jgi:hypothetical protein
MLQQAQLKPHGSRERPAHFFRIYREARTLGAMNRKRRRAWVDGKEFGSEKEAAQAAGVSASTVCDALKAGGRPAGGRMITAGPPRKKPEKNPPFRLAKALLYYPPGEGPLDRGNRHWY